VEVNHSFWKNKRVLITGHTGFKGSWLSLWLKQLGAEVIGYALEQKISASLFEVAKVKQGMVTLYGDILDLTTVKDVINTYEPEIIFHLAAQSIVKESYENPLETFATNVMGTVNIFEAARQSKSIKAIINVTSDKCYDNRELPYWGYRENDPMGGYDPYSASKGCAELVTNSYRNSFFNETKIKLVSVRAGNVIGGGDWAENRLIPDIVRSIESGQLLSIRNPGAIRPWQHVLEPLSGYLILAQNLYTHESDYTGGWNFGPRDEGIVSVEKLLILFEKVWKQKFNVQYERQTTFHEAHYLKLDCSKVFYKLKWQPKLDIEETVNWTASWYKTYLEGLDMREYTLKQIHDYMEL